MSIAEFVGGPLDGKLRAFPEDEPPLTVTLIRVQNDDLTYVRRVSERDEGPLWQYTLKETT